jgi:hypothetical protein
MPLYQLTDADRCELVQPASQFNRWLTSLIDTVRVSGGVTETQRDALGALKTLMSVTRTVKGETHTFEHFVSNCSSDDVIQMMLNGDEKFVTEVVPRIKVLSPLAITSAQLASFSPSTQAAVRKHISILGRMSADFQKWLLSKQLLSASQPLIPGAAAIASGGVDLSSLMSQLPDEFKSIIESQGGVEALMQNPAILQMISEGGGVGGAIGGGMFAGIMGLVSEFKDLYNDISKKQTLSENDKIEAAAKLRSILERHLSDETSIISTAYTHVEKQFPNGLDTQKLEDLLIRARGFLNLLGPKRCDPVWQLLDFIKKSMRRLQKRTKNTPVTRKTVAEKLEVLLLIIGRSTGSEELSYYEMFQQSETLQSVVGLLTGSGAAMSHVNSDPFGVGGGGGGGDTTMVDKMGGMLKMLGVEVGEGGLLSSLSGVFGGGGNSAGEQEEDSWSDDEDTTV